MLEITQILLPRSRTGGGSAWQATATVNGETFATASRHGAPQALARVLVAAGVPDQAVEVTTENLKGVTRYRSLHTMAKQTISEGVNQPIHSRNWRPMPPNIDAGIGGGPQKEPSSFENGVE